jgi:hypothetical protein
MVNFDPCEEKYIPPGNFINQAWQWKPAADYAQGFNTFPLHAYTSQYK